MRRHRKQREFISDENDAIVGRVFEKIASILLRIGLDSPRSEAQLRRSFVSAAINRARISAKRSTQSQIALTAGVSRLDVRRILAERQAENPRESSKAQSRVDGILEAWRRDRDFSNGRGRPKELTFVGVGSQFEKLVRKYGRDITARTLRDDLIKKRLVFVSGTRLILAARATSKDLRRPSAHADLSFLDSQLSLFDFHAGRRAFSTRNLELRADDAKTLKLIQRKAVAKLETALYALESVRRMRPLARRNARRRIRMHRLLISATLSAESDEDRE